MATNYSFLKGLGKGIVASAIAGFSILGFVLLSTSPDIYNASIADVVSQSIKEILGGMTVGGALAFVINFLKVNYSR